MLFYAQNSEIFEIIMLIFLIFKMIFLKRLKSKNISLLQLEMFQKIKI